MGLVYVVGFCTTDFPDGTTGSVPDWAWAALREPARTSNPKDVVLSHGNVISNLLGVQDGLPIGNVDRSLAFLP